MVDGVKVQSDTEMLDFFEKNNHNFIQLGKHWYVRVASGYPFHKRKSLRDAIIAGMKLNAPVKEPAFMNINLCQEVISPANSSEHTVSLRIVS
jgi:hypothetical protein